MGTSMCIHALDTQNLSTGQLTISTNECGSLDWKEKNNYNLERLLINMVNSYALHSEIIGPLVAWERSQPLYWEVHHQWPPRNGSLQDLRDLLDSGSVRRYTSREPQIILIILKST